MRGMEKKRKKIKRKTLGKTRLAKVSTPNRCKTNTCLFLQPLVQ
jgi:hypothetical protein